MAIPDECMTFPRVDPFDSTNAAILEKRRRSDDEVKNRLEELRDRMFEYQQLITEAEHQLNLLGRQYDRLDEQTNLPGENPG